ncbi:MAG: lipoprotein [Candidatus Peribacteria bacterium]|jgi:PBP1b-binding outer membrane lipoprotein LpoB|nr:lipoprotein [Candidatus Peribacteria bacterium]
MKKIILLFAILSTLFLTSCSIYNPKNEEPKSEENPITSNSGSLEVES